MAVNFWHLAIAQFKQRFGQCTYRFFAQSSFKMARTPTILLDIELDLSHPWSFRLAMSNLTFDKVCFIAVVMASSVVIIKGMK